MAKQDANAGTEACITQAECVKQLTIIKNISLIYTHVALCANGLQAIATICSIIQLDKYSPVVFGCNKKSKGPYYKY